MVQSLSLSLHLLQCCPTSRRNIFLPQYFFSLFLFAFLPASSSSSISVRGKSVQRFSLHSLQMSLHHIFIQLYYDYITFFFFPYLKKNKYCIYFFSSPTPMANLFCIIYSAYMLLLLGYTHIFYNKLYKIFLCGHHHRNHILYRVFIYS